jgi:hypothetical protein
MYRFLFVLSVFALVGCAEAANLQHQAATSSIVSALTAAKTTCPDFFSGKFMPKKNAEKNSGCVVQSFANIPNKPLPVLTMEMSISTVATEYAEGRISHQQYKNRSKEAMLQMAQSLEQNYQRDLAYAQERDERRSERMMHMSGVLLQQGAAQSARTFKTTNCTGWSNNVSCTSY